MKNIYFIITTLLVLIYIVHEVRKKDFSIKESFWWVVTSIVMLILSIFPYSIDKIAKIFNIEYGPSILFAFGIVFLIIINFKNSKRICKLEEKIVELEQHLAIIKGEKNDKK